MTACIINFQQPDPLYLLMLAIFVFICSAVCYHNSCYFFLSMQGGPQVPRITTTYWKPSYKDFYQVLTFSLLNYQMKNNL